MQELLAIGLLAAGSLLTRKIDLTGALTGGGIAYVLLQGGGWATLSWLAAFFVLGTLASMHGSRRKTLLGVAEPNKGKRTATNVLANAGVAGSLGGLAWALPEHAPALVAMLGASIASATSDTVSSEMGNLYGKNYVNIRTWRPDVRGRDGAISLEGTALGALASAAMGVLVATSAAWAQPAEVGAITAAAGLVGNLTDSLLGATWQRVGWLNNHTVNFFSTLAAALLAGAWWWAANGGLF